jgi:hypothetical protein
MKLLSVLIIFALVLTMGTDTLAETSHNKAQDNTAKSEGEHGNGTLYPQPKPNLDNGRQPGKVDLTQPAFRATITSPNVILKWKASKDAKNYHLQVATDPNFKWLKVDEHLLAETEYEVRQLEENKHYYWRVAPTNQERWAGSTKGYYSSSMFQTK